MKWSTKQKVSVSKQEVVVLSKKRVSIGLLIAIMVIALWYLVVPLVVKQFPHPPARLKLIISVGLGEVGILVALIVGMLSDGVGFHIPLSRPDHQRWKDWLSLPLVLFWHFSMSILFALVYFILTRHQLPTSSPANVDFGTLVSMNRVLLFFTALIVAGLAAFVEEFFFRGYLISRLSQLGIHPVVAGVIAGLLFALLHVPSYGLIVSLPKFLGLGLFAGVYVGMRGRLWPMIVAHFIIDFAGLLALGWVTLH